MKTVKWLFFLGLTATSCAKVPLEVIEMGELVEINVELLGEYPSTVERIRVSQVKTNDVVWEIEAVSIAPQLWKFDLRPGLNPVHLALPIKRGAFRVLQPERDENFVLENGIEYRIKVWGSKSETPRSRVFVLSQPSQEGGLKP